MVKIFNEDCFLTMNRILKASGGVDIVLTSPPL